MASRKFLLLLGSLACLVGSAFAQTVNTEATVAHLTGSATLTFADGSMSALAPGAKVPQGATITTGADGDVYLETHPGYIASIKPNSTVAVAELSVTSKDGKVTEEKTLLDLKSGDLVSVLDPKKRAVNNYNVRTPKGVAAAHGTVYTVSYKGGNYSIAVINGTVTITPPPNSISGDAPITVGSGQGAFSVQGNAISSPTALSQTADWFRSVGDGGAGRAMNNQAAGQIDQMAADFRQILAIAVATVAVAAQNHIGGTTAADVQAIANIVIKADPASSATIAVLVSASAPQMSGTLQQIIQQNGPAPAAPILTPVQPIDPASVSRPD